MTTYQIQGPDYSVVVTPSDEGDCEVQIKNDVHAFTLGFHMATDRPRVVTEFSGAAARVSSSVETLPTEATPPSGDAVSSRTLNGVYYSVSGGALRLPDGTWLKG